MADKKISQLTGATTPLVGTEVLPIVQSGSTVKVSVDNLTAGKSVSAASFVPTSATVPTNGIFLGAANSVSVATNSTEHWMVNASGNLNPVGAKGIGTDAAPVSEAVATTFSTSATAAGSNLTENTLAADGTDADIDINITPKGAGGAVLGNGNTSATPANGLLRGTDGSGTNITGATLTIQGGRGTGSGAGGPIVFSTSAAGASGTTLRTATQRMFVAPDGGLSINTTVSGSTFGAENSGGQLIIGSGAASQGMTIYTGTANNGTINFADGTTGNATYRGFIQYQHASDSLKIATAANDRIHISSVGNVSIGGNAARATTAGTNALQIFNGTAPVGTLTNGVSLYSSSGEAYVMDAAGNATLFSPHDSETNEWIFKSKHTPTGKVLRIDVERLLRFVNDHFGLDAVHNFIEE